MNRGVVRPSAAVAKFLDAVFSASSTTGDQLASTVRSCSLSWGDLVRDSIDLYLAPSLRFEMQTTGVWDLVPAAAQDILGELADLNRARNQKILATISDIAMKVGARSATPVFLKGAACLMSGVYGDLARRFMMDIDVLVPADEFQVSISALMESGYCLPEQHLSSDTLIGKHYHPLVAPNGITVEVHRCLGVLNSSLTPQEIMRDAIALERGRAQIRIPRREHILIHHVLHAQERLRDRLWPRVQQLIDLKILVDGWEDSLDWAYVYEHLRCEGKARGLQSISRSAAELLQCVREGQSAFCAMPAATGIHDRLLRRFPFARHFDPAYMSSMWAGEKVRRLRKRLTGAEGRAWLRRRVVSREFWSRTAAELRAI
jgi:hypothetical protein